MKQRKFFFYEADTRDRSRFFLQDGHETTYESTGDKHFFTILCHCQTYQNYQPIPQRSENSYFQSYFSALNISGIILNFFSVKNIRLGDQFLLVKLFENFYF